MENKYLDYARKGALVGLAGLALLASGCVSAMDKKYSKTRTSIDYQRVIDYPKRTFGFEDYEILKLINYFLLKSH